MIRFSANVLLGKGLAASGIRISVERNMKCGIGLCGHCQLGPLLVCRDGPVSTTSRPGPCCHEGALMALMTSRPPTLAVWKFASCDGCQLTLLDCEDELLALASQVRIAHFLEASSEV